MIVCAKLAQINHGVLLMMLLRLLLVGMLSLSLLLVSACHQTRLFEEKDGPPPFNVDVSKIPDAVPKPEPLSQSGNAPYKVYGKRYRVMKSSKGYKQQGYASWYGTKFHSKRTSSGEPYSMVGMTAAHRTLPLPTYVKVTNLQNGKQVIVKVNDRGPFHSSRIIDLSYAAAKKIGLAGRGTGLVEVEAIDPHKPPKKSLAKKEPEKQLAQADPIYLQIGAFSQRANAEHLTKQIQELTDAIISIKVGRSQEKPIYRVHIGPLASAERTKKLQQRLKAAGLGEAKVVAK